LQDNNNNNNNNNNNKWILSKWFMQITVKEQ